MTYSGPARILIVDDDEENADAIAAVLHDLGHHVEHCTDALAAVEYLSKAEAPNLILLDLMMPRMNGWEFRVVQRRDPAWANIPVIALSGDTSSKARSIDADAYLTKPVDLVLLLDTVDRLLSAADERKTVARARELERLSSLGVLASSLAHEINNPLSVALGFVMVARRAGSALEKAAGLDGQESVRLLAQSLDRIEQSTQRIASVVREIATFARASEADEVDVVEVLEGSARLVSNRIRLKAALERSYERVPRVFCSPAKLGQLFLTLLIRATHALEESDGAEDNLVRLAVYPADDRCVAIRISDTGRGLPPEQIGRVFEPLGSGQRGAPPGAVELSLVRRLVHEMGGSISVESSVGVGTTFQIILPCNTKSETKAQPPLVRRIMARPDRPRVLVVDDDDGMCRVLRVLLQDRYQVEAENDPVRGLELLSQGTPFDVILCDLMMPRLTGMDLYEKLRALRPEQSARMIFMTGGTFSKQAADFVAKLESYLTKPFAPQALEAAIEDRIAGLGASETDGAP